MNNDDLLPPPFVVGERYFDRIGEYTVQDTDGDRITIERADGRRTIENMSFKALIHRNILIERADVGGDRRRLTVGRREPTGRRKELVDRILRLEADGAAHSGVEIDRLLASVAEQLGYSAEDVSRLLPQTGRSAFANDGDWAKATMTEQRLHEVVGTAVLWERGTRHQCNVYRITPSGLDEVRRRGLGQPFTLRDENRTR